MKQYGKWAFGLTALVIAVRGGKNMTGLIDSGSRGVSTVWKTAQGR